VLLVEAMLVVVAKKLSGEDSHRTTLYPPEAE
jgi:hypothetical protein